MKLLSKDVLRDYGFVDNTEKSTITFEIMSRDKFDIVIKNNGSFYYSNVGIDYPLKDAASLRKLYREVTREDLAPKFKEIKQC